MTNLLFEIVPPSPATTTPLDADPASADGVKDGVYDVLSRVPPSDMNLLVLSYQSSPDTWLDNWQKQVEAFPQEIGFIRIGETTRASATSEKRSVHGDSSFLVEGLADPTDLTGLKDLIRAYLDEWVNDDQQTVIYLDSLTPLLRAVGLTTTYRFLHILTDRIKSVGGYGYYPVESKADTPELADLLYELADNRITLTESAQCRRSTCEQNIKRIAGED